MTAKLKTYLRVNKKHIGEKRKTYAKLFLKFLLTNNAYTSFIYNFSIVDDDWVRRFHPTTEGYERYFIHLAFDWKLTKEQGPFWNHLDEEWKKVFDKQKNE